MSATRAAAPSASTDAPVLVGAVVFTDLVGFTEFTDACGDESAIRVIDRMRVVADAAVARTDGGRVVKELGDGLLVWFPSARHAADAILAFVGEITALRAADEFPLALRVGAHHGEVRRRGDDLVGQTVNIAARIVDLAGPMEIVVSEAFVRECGDAPAGAAFEPIGPTTVKGVAETLWLYRVARSPTNFEQLAARR